MSVSGHPPDGTVRPPRWMRGRESPGSEPESNGLRSCTQAWAHGEARRGSAVCSATLRSRRRRCRSWASRSPRSQVPAQRSRPDGTIRTPQSRRTASAVTNRCLCHGRERAARSGGRCRGIRRARIEQCRQGRRSGRHVEPEKVVLGLAPARSEQSTKQRSHVPFPRLVFRGQRLGRRSIMSSTK